MQKTIVTIVVFFLTALCLVLGPLAALAESVQEQREDSLQLSDDTLNQLYRLVSGAREAVRDAAGYGVFSDKSMKILTFGSGLGKGVVINNTTQKATYMLMGEVQAGLGLGISKFRQVFVFQTQAALNDFINTGIELGAQMTGAAQAGGQGGSIDGAINVAPGVWVFQITEAGLAAELGITGAKYFKDDKLN